MKKMMTWVVTLLAATPLLQAQTTIQVQAPGIVAADEQFNVTFVVEGESAPSAFSWEPGDDFKLVWGPQKGTSTSVTIINGKKTRSSQTTYTYVLMPRTKGTFTLPAATASVKGDKISSGRFRIEVVTNAATPSGGGNAGSAPSQQQPSSQAAVGEVPSSDLFLRLTLNRNSVVVGEPVTATLKLYQRVSIAGFEDAKFPTFNGFWSQEVFAPTNIEFHRESIDDKIYNAAVLRRWVLIPQQAGDISIEPAELVCQVTVRTQSGPRSIFDSFFDDDVRPLRKRITSARQTVRVSPLPAGAPASFGGGVGKFDISARLSKDSLSAHDAASLLVTVSGKGNVSLLEAPKVSFPPDFDVYDVKVTENTDKSTGRTSGSKTFEYPFIPRSAGDFTIEPIPYSYYDVEAHKYVTLSTRPLPIKVGRGNAPEAIAVAEGSSLPGVMRKDVRDLGSDIRYISTRVPAFRPKGAFFCFSPLFWVLLVALLALAAATFFVLRTRAARRADVALTRNRGAVKMARRRLSQAGDFLAKNLPTAFYEELHKALLGYVSDKLGLDMTDMTRERVAESLRAAGATDAHAEALTGLLDACEYARYSPDTTHEAMNTHYEAALDAIATLENDMKHKPSAPATNLKAIVLILLLVNPVILSEAKDLHPATPDTLWTTAVSAYAEGQYPTAFQTWQAIESAGLESPALYTNLGDAAFKSGDLARAILYYERALQLDPSAADARYNLAYANTFVQDRIDVVPEFFLKTALRRFSHLLSSDAWAVLFLVLLALSLAALLIFLLSTSRPLRKAGFYTAIPVFLLAVLCLTFSARQRAAYQKSDAAIIIRPVVSAKSSPGSEGAKDLFLLHEGTRVRVTDRVGDWENIVLTDGREGWISASDADLI